MSNRQEKLDVLNPNGVPTGLQRPRGVRLDFHHRIVRIWLVLHDRSTLLQKRSPAKRVHPGMWDASAAGHVRAGESSLEAAVRETQEEVGILARGVDYEMLGTFVHGLTFNDVYVLRTEHSPLRPRTRELTEMMRVPLVSVVTENRSLPGDMVRFSDERLLLGRWLSANL